MAISYKKNDTNTSIAFGNTYSVRLGFGTYILTRAFMKFDLSAQGLTVADVESATLNIKISAVSFNNCDVCCKSAISTDDNWGATLDASQADFEGTAAHLEDTISLTTTFTGWKSFDIDINNLDFAGTTYFKLCSSLENTTTNGGVTFASQNNGTAADRPYLQLVLKASGQVIRILCS